MAKPDERILAPLPLLVRDDNVYPRHHVEAGHVGALVDALKMGAILPEIVASPVKPKPEKGRPSYRIVDGVHRYEAYRRVVGENAAVQIILRYYASEADLVLDAIALNAAHGRPLDRMDQARAVLIAENVGASLPSIALTLQIPEAKVEKLRIRVAYAEEAELASVPGTNQIVLKRPAAHLRGRTLTVAQIEAHNMMPGTSLLLTARQLRAALEADMIDIEDERLHDELRRLSRTLSEWLMDPGRKAA